MEALPLIQYVDKLYQQLLPEKHQEQAELAAQVPNFVIPNTVFTTLTINYNWQTASHVDKGDYRNGYSGMVVCERGTWEGCLLGFPQFSCAVVIREGDFILMDPHQCHGNTELDLQSDDACRMSIVFYFREGMLKCATRS